MQSFDLVLLIALRFFFFVAIFEEKQNEYIQNYELDNDY